MEGFDLFHAEFWHPFDRFGLTSSYLYLSKETLIFTWITLGILLITALIANYFLRRPESIGHTVVLEGVDMLAGMARQAIDKVQDKHIIFISSLFIFIFLCNIVVIIPGCEEPTKDLSTTFALALLSFFYIQKESIRARGFIPYAEELFKMPFSLALTSYSIISLGWWIIKLVLNIVMGILSFPLEAISKVSSVISLSFRLFGNIFGGSVITLLWKKVLAIHPLIQVGTLPITLVIMLFFGLFEGFIQAFVFATLSVTYLGINMSTEH